MADGVATRPEDKVDPIVRQVDKWKSDEQAAISRVLRDFEDSRSRRQSREDDWDEFYRLWRNKIKLFEKYPWISQAFLPLTFRDVETLVPFMQASTWSDKNFVKGWGQEEQDKGDAATVGEFMDYQFTELMDYGVTNEDLIRSALQYGTSYAKVFARDDSQPTFQDLEEDGEELTDDQKKERGFFLDGRTMRRKVYKGGWVRYVSPYDLYPDHDNIEDQNNWRYAIHRYAVPLSKLFEQAKSQDATEEGKQILKNLEKIAQTSRTDPDETREQRREHQSVGTGHLSEGGTGVDNAREDMMVEVMDYWTPTWLIRLVNRQVVIFNDANPLPFQEIPFIRYVWTRDTDFGYGVGMIEIMRSPQNIINILLNQHLDNVNLSLNPMKKVRRGSAININQLISRVGGIIEVNDPSDVTNDETPDTTGKAFANIGQVISVTEQATGVLDLFRGAEPQTSRFPAAGISLQQRATARRFGLQQGHWLRNQKKMFGWIHAINKEMVEDQEFLKIVGERGTAEYPKITTTMLKQTFVDFIPMSTPSNANPEVTAQILMDLDSRWQDRQNMQGEPQLELMRTILEQLGVNKMSSILPRFGVPGTAQPEQAPPEQAGATPGPVAFAQLAAQAAGGGLAPEGAFAGAASGAPPAEFINQPPSTTNPGGGRVIRIRQ